MNTPLQPQFAGQTVPQSSHTSVIFFYGMFMVAWSVAEGVVQAAIMKNLRVEPSDAVVVTGKMQFNPRVQLLCALLKREGDKYKEAIKLLNKTEGSAQRNTLVHGHIIVGVPDQLTFVKYDGGASVKQTFTSEDMKKHVEALNDWVVNLKNLLQITDADCQLICDATLGMVK
jgi:hypothetical protein